MKVCGMTGDQVQGLVRYWQEKLRLRDWDISVEFVDPRDIPDSWGSNEYEADLLRAKIKISTDQPSMRCLIDTICHELLHLMFHLAEPETPEMRITEQGIVRIAPVLAEFYLGSLPSTKRCEGNCRSSAARKKVSRKRSGRSTSTRRKFGAG